MTMCNRTPRRLRFVLAAGLVPLWLGAMPASARAEVGGATLVVRVLDPAGEPMLGATVTIEYAGGGVWRRTTDQRAEATFVNLPAGSAVVDLQLPGLKRMQLRVRLRHGEAVLLVGTLAPGAIFDVIDMPTHARDRFRMAITTERGDGGGRGYHDAPEWSQKDVALRDLPSSRDIWSLLETAEPAAILDRMDGAGLYLGEPGRFSMRGASWTQNTILLDGLDVTDPLRGGTPLATPDNEALEAIDVTSALAPVEYGAPGVTLSLAPREPGVTWRGTAQVYGLSSGLQAQDPVGEAPSIARFDSLVDMSALGSGPLRGETLRGLFSARLARSRRLARADPTELEARVGSLFGHIVLRPGQRDNLRALASLESVRRPFAARALFSGEPPDERADSLATQLRWDHFGESSTWSTSAGLTRGTFEPLTEGRTPDRPSERLLDGPVPELVFPARSVRSRWSLSSSLALREHRVAGLWHAPRFGVDLGRAAATDDPRDTLSIGEKVDGLAARLWTYSWGGGPSFRRTTDFAAYAADRIVWRDRLFVEAGLRLDSSSGKADGATPGISWTTLSPRVSARLRLTEAGRISIFGGYGRYRHRLLLDHLAFGDPNGPSGSVYRWSDTNADGLVDAGERGPLVARIGPGSPDGVLTSIDPSLAPPRTRELVVGLESNLGREWRFRFTGFDRRERSLVETVNVGVPQSGYTVRYIPDPAGDLVGAQDDQLLPVYDRRPETFGLDRYVLTNPADHVSLHQSAEARLEKQLGSRLLFVAGATAVRTEMRGANRGFRVMENDQGVVGEIYDNPNADTFAKGRSIFDRAFTIKVATAYRAPGDLRLGVVARYQDGQTFARNVVVADLAQGPEAIPAIPRGQIERAWAKDDQGRYIVPSGHRFSFSLTVDARIEKGLRWGRRRLALIAEAFNLPGMRREVEERDVWGSRFREPTAFQSPRVIRLGARLDF
jgi:hypothetical protein